MGKKLTYQESGVDIKAVSSIKKKIGELVKETFTSSTISEFGLFGGIYQEEQSSHRPMGSEQSCSSLRR